MNSGRDVIDLSDVPCERCGTLLDWVDCAACGGTGRIREMWYCPQCAHHGGFWYCPNQECQPAEAVSR